MPSEMELEELARRLSTIEAQNAAISRILRRILDLDEGNELDREVLLSFRAAIAYAVKMQRRESETEDLLECVRGWRTSANKRKSSRWALVRAVILGLFAAVTGALATKFLGK